MATKKYKAEVKTARGTTVKAYVEADSSSDAKDLLEGQYGKGNVSFVTSV